MRFERIRVARSDHVCEVELTGEPLGAVEAAELAAAIDDLAEDRSVRVVVLRSADKDFCPGADPRSDPTTIGINPPATLSALRVPVIAAVRGRAVSVGLEITLAADVVIAADTARFGLPDVGAGRLPHWGGIQRLVRAAGAPIALAMALLGEELDAATAAQVGLAYRVVGDAELEVATAAVVDQLVGIGPLAAEFAKEAVRTGFELPMRDGFRLEADLNHLLATSADRAEGLQAFFEKRKPHFEGR